MKSPDTSSVRPEPVEGRVPEHVLRQAQHERLGWGSDLAPRRSAAIAIARVLCILGIVYVHAWTGLDGHRLMLARDTGQGMLRWALIELVGRAAVPLLGAVSGWLAAGSAAKRGWGAFMAGKLRVIALPMVAWNVIAIALVSGASLAGWIAAPIPRDAWALLNELTALARPNEINVQMPFLRDLLLCMALAPLLARAPAWAVAAVSMGAAAWSVVGVSPAFPLLLRPSILAFFALGLLLARRRGAVERIGGGPLALALATYLTLAVVRTWVEIAYDDPARDWPLAVNAFDLATRAAACLLFWKLAWRLAGTTLSPALARLERFAFFTFCAHLVLIWLLGPTIGGVTGRLGAPGYPVFLLLQPYLAFAASAGIALVLERHTPRAARILSGGRLARA